MKKENAKNIEHPFYSIYVGNLNYKLDENHLLGLFKKYGFIRKINVVKDKKNQKNTGIAFVEMAKYDHVKTAIEKLNNTLQFGRTIKVSLAQRQEQETIKTQEKITLEDKPSRKNSINKLKRDKRLRKKTLFNSGFKNS